MNVINENEHDSSTHRERVKWEYFRWLGVLRGKISHQPWFFTRNAFSAFFESTLSCEIFTLCFPPLKPPLISTHLRWFWGWIFSLTTFDLDEILVTGKTKFYHLAKVQYGMSYAFYLIMFQNGIDFRSFEHKCYPANINGRITKLKDLVYIATEDLASPRIRSLQEKYYYLLIQWHFTP